jgi:hypothetical protein
MGLKEYQQRSKACSTKALSPKGKHEVRSGTSAPSSVLMEEMKLMRGQGITGSGLAIGFLVLTLGTTLPATAAERLRTVSAADIQSYCQRQNKSAQLVINNAYGWRCTDGKAPNPLNMRQLCQSFPDAPKTKVIERLANMDDPQTGWECWSWETGRVVYGIDETTFSHFCRLLGYKDVSRVSNNAYGWRCTGANRADSFSVTQVCHVLSQLPNVVDRVGEFYKPDSWECWY